MKKLLLLLGWCLGVGALVASPVVFYVDAQRGKDTNAGTLEAPFATPEYARDVLRKTPHPDGAVVYLQGEFTSLDKTLLQLWQKDSGVDAKHPTVWKAWGRGALLRGACNLTAQDFKPVSGEVAARLLPAARSHVQVCDLAAHGVGTLPPLPAKFNKWSEMELISSGKAMTIARYPNQGWLEITNVIDRGVAPCDRTKDEWEFGVRGGVFEYYDKAAERWNVAEGVYLFGFWCYDWSSDTLRVAKIDKTAKTITMEGIHTYGLGKPSKWNQAKVRYFAYNMLEELDSPGEWYVDRKARLLYFYPTEDGFKDVALSILKAPLVKMENVANVKIEGLTFKYSTGRAVEMGGCANVCLNGLNVSWLSQDAISVWSGENVTVQNCHLEQIGSTGLAVYGGDRKTLKKCGHRVYNNDIGYCGRLARISGPCLTFGGCGITIEHNYLHDTPYITMSYGGNEHLIQYNEIECAMLEAGDGGGVYTGRDWGSRGNVIRWNYLHHFGKDGVDWREAQGRPSGCEALKKDVMVEGIYLDDCDSGETIYGNIFYKAGRAMFTGGGRDNLWLHNIVIDCTTAVHFDTRGLQRAKPGSGLQNGWDLLAKIERYDYTKEPWCSRYPQLLGIMDKEPLLPINTAYVSNIAVRCGYFYNSWGDATKFLQDRAPNVANVSYNAQNVAREQREYPQTNATLRAKMEIRKDDAFTECALSDPLKLQDSEMFKKAFPDFPRIPVEKIGLEKQSLENLPWLGDGVSAPTNEAEFYDEDPAPCFQSSFVLPRGVKSTTLEVACAGYYLIKLNGKRPVQYTGLMPLWSPFDHTIYTDIVKFPAEVFKPWPATNRVTVLLGNGFYNLPPLRFWGGLCFRNKLAHGRPCFKVALGCAGGELEWQWRRSNIVRNCVYLGCEVDATRPADETWKPAVAVEGPKGKLVPRRAPPMVSFMPVPGKAKWLKPGSVQVIDFGENMTGVPTFIFEGQKPGTKIEIVYGERLNADGSVNVLTQTAGQIKSGNGGPGAPRVAAQRDVYVCNTRDCRHTVQEMEGFSPKFTWHIFRYAEVRGYNHLLEGPAAATVSRVSVALCDPPKEALRRPRQEFAKIHEMCQRTFRAGVTGGVQSDCPGRERLGYGGDIVATCEAFMLNWDMREFYLKTLQDFADEASEDGWITETAPYVGIADQGFGGRAGPISWTVAVPVLMDALMRHYPDVTDRALAYYPVCARYVRLVQAMYPSGIIPRCIGDHEALERAPNEVTATAHWYQFLMLTAKFARQLAAGTGSAVQGGYDYVADAKLFAEWAAQVKSAFIARYVKQGVVANGSQSAQALALYMGLVSEAEIPAAEAALVKELEVKNFAPHTGIFSTRYMLMYLSEHGKRDLAEKVVLHAGFPGWLHMLDRGATTLWETWRESDNVYSNCHPMFGSVDEWILRFGCE